MYRGVPILLIDMLCVAEFATDTEMPMSAIYTEAVMVTLELDTYLNGQILHNQDVLRLDVLVHYVASVQDGKALRD